jgi:hypothetical protein
MSQKSVAGEMELTHHKHLVQKGKHILSRKAWRLDKNRSTGMHKVIRNAETHCHSPATDKVVRKAPTWVHQP